MVGIAVISEVDVHGKIFTIALRALELVSYFNTVTCHINFISMSYLC